MLPKSTRWPLGFRLAGWLDCWLAGLRLLSKQISSANGQCQWSVPMPMQEPVPVATVGMPFGRLRYVGLFVFCDHPINRVAHIKTLGTNLGPHNAHLPLQLGPCGARWAPRRALATVIETLGEPLEPESAHGSLPLGYLGEHLGPPNAHWGTPALLPLPSPRGLAVSGEPGIGELRSTRGWSGTASLEVLGGKAGLTFGGTPMM